MIKTHTDFIEEIRERLKGLNPYKIVLFGSSAEGGRKRDSDIDLLVILDSDDICLSFEEKMQNKLLVRRSIYDISKKIPVDLLVFTRKEYEAIMENSNSFFREIDSRGKVLYEKAS